MALAALVLALPVALPYALPWIAARQGLQVALARASYGLPGPELRLEGLEVGPAGAALAVRDLRLALDLRALLNGTLRLARLEAEDGSVALVAPPGDLRIALAPGRTLAIPPVTALRVADLSVGSADGRLPPLRLEALRSVATDAGEGTARTLEVTARLAGARVEFRGGLEAGGRGPESEGTLRLGGFPLAVLGPLLPALIDGVQAGDADAELRLRLGPASGGGLALSAEGTLEVRGLTWAGPGLGVRDGRGRWEGRIEIAGVPGPAGLVEAAGRLVLDGGRLWRAGAPVPLEVDLEGARGEGRVTGSGGPRLDGDLRAARVRVRAGAWAGLVVEDLAAWGVRGSADGALAVGQLQAARAARDAGPDGEVRADGALPTGAAESIEVRGLSVDAGGLAADRLVARGVTLGLGAADRVAAGGVEAAGVVLAGGWGRVESLDLSGLRLATGVPDSGLEAGSVTALGVRVAAGEPVHLGEVRASGVTLALARGPLGAWPRALPAITLDSLLVGEGSRVLWTDRSARPTVRLALTDLTGRIAAWDPHHPGRFALEARVDGQGQVRVRGELGASPGMQGGTLHGEGEDLPVAAIARYARARVGADLPGDRIDARLDLRATGGGWAGRAVLDPRAPRSGSPDPDSAPGVDAEPGPIEIPVAIGP